MRLNTIFNSATSHIISSQACLVDSISITSVPINTAPPILGISPINTFQSQSVPTTNTNPIVAPTPTPRPRPTPTPITPTLPSREEPGTWCWWGGGRTWRGFRWRAQRWWGTSTDYCGSLRADCTHLCGERGTLPTFPTLRVRTERRTRTRRLSTWRQRRWLSRRSRFRMEVAAWSRKSRGSR